MKFNQVYCKVSYDLVHFGEILAQSSSKYIKTVSLNVFLVSLSGAGIYPQRNLFGFFIVKFALHHIFPFCLCCLLGTDFSGQTNHIKVAR